MFTPPFLAKTAVGCFAFFGAINLCFLPIIHFYYIETAGRSLEGASPSSLSPLSQECRTSLARPS